MGTLGGLNVWKVTAEERVKHDEQFFTLKPVNGFITGDQARGFFLQSGLPSAVLAQIWNLADLNKDGKMDRREFSIAMYLIQKKLQGFSIPPTLPETLKSDPDPAVGVFGTVGFVGNAAPAVSAPGQWMQQAPTGMMPPVTAGYPPQSVVSMAPTSNTPTVTAASPLTLPRTTSGKIDWSMNQVSKLKYSQHFNSIDKNRTGFLSGTHARNIFTQAGLPNPILAQIWNFSDLDKDGKLTVEEFCIAMHLIDMIKLGATLPPVLPTDLVPPHLQHLHRQRNLSFGSDDAANDDGDMSKGKSAVSFEDKRRQNFEKGQAELDRRRQILLEQERREREERERKEREEFERRERERLEFERRRQLELEKLQAKQREEQQKQEEEYRKMMEQREAARRELERQRQQEWERQRLNELTTQRQRDQENLCHTKQKQKNLSFQLQALNEKSQDLNGQITEVREKIVALTSSIEGMKRDRDTKLVSIENGKRMAQELKTKSMQLGNEKLKLMGQRSGGGGGTGGSGNSVFESYQQVVQTYRNREINLESLKQSLSELEGELKEKQPNVDEKEKEFNDANEKVKQDAEEYRQLVSRFNDALAKVRQAGGGGVAVAPAVAALAWAAPTVGAPAGAAPAVGAPAGAAPAVEAPAGAAPAVEAPAGAAPAVEAPAGAPATAAPVVDDSAWGGVQPTNGVSGASGGGFFDDSAWGAALDQAPVGEGAWATDDAWKAANGHSTSAASAVESGQPVNTVRYRAVFEFSGANADELSFQPGDVIIVFRDHHGDEGWLAGQIGTKVGWFPQAFAEPIDETGQEHAGAVTTPQSPQQSLPQKLERIQEAPFEREDDARSSTRSSNLGGRVSRVKQQEAPQSSVVQDGEMVQAQFAWKAKTENHLSFNKGDQIKILEKQEMWWRGELNGANGWFPKSYVKPVEGQRRMSEIPAWMAAKKANESNVPPPFKRKSESQEFPSQAAIAATKVGENGEWYVAVYQFETTEPGDLRFEAGEKILVIEKNEDWWTGRIDEREGVFPANYVQKVEQGTSDNPAGHPSYQHSNDVRAPSVEIEESGEVGEAIASYKGTDNNQLTLTVGDFVKIRSKSPTGWWEGEIQKKGESKRVGWFPGNYVKVLQVEKVVENSREVVQALFDYNKQQDDEIDFKRGDRIVVVEKMDENWWKGELTDGKRGLFPANYVKPIEDS